MAKNNKKNVNNVVENNEKKFEVRDAVVATAQSGKAYGLNADVSEERQAAHVSVCKQLVNLWDKFAKYLGDAHYILLMFAINQGGAKWDVYRKGYKAIDMTRLNQLPEWYAAYIKAGKGGGSKDVIARTCYRFFEKWRKTCKNVIKIRAAFFNALKQAEELGKHTGTGHGDCKAMLKNLGIILDKTEVKDDEVEAA